MFYVTHWAKIPLFTGVVGIFEEENFREFHGFVPFCWSFLCEIWGRSVLWCGESEQSAKVFSTKIVNFHQFAKTFSLKRFLLYGMKMVHWHVIVRQWKMETIGCLVTEWNASRTQGCRMQLFEKSQWFFFGVTVNFNVSICTIVLCINLTRVFVKGSLKVGKDSWKGQQWWKWGLTLCL